MPIEELEKISSDIIQDSSMPPVPISKRKYGGKFVAILNKKVVASGATHIQTRHKVRKKIRANDRKSVKYYFIERKSNLLRSLFFCFIAFILVNIQLTEKLMIFPVESIDFIFSIKRITILLFFDITIVTSAIALTTLIDPIFRSHVDQGVIGDSIKRQEHQVGWEIALTTTTGYVLLVSIVGQLWISTEFNLIFELTNLTYLIILILFVQIYYILIEDRKLKQLHNYLIDTITSNDRLSYEEIADYLKEIPQFQKSNPDPTLLLETIEASIESPFSIRNVIVFRIFIRDLSIMISSILIPFIITYILFSDKFISRISGGFISAILILFYGGVKQNSSDQWTPKFIAEHPKYTLKPGGVDRVYLKFFPNQVKKQKEETALTILTQSVAFSRGIGLTLLFYSAFSSFLILMNLSNFLANLLESLLIIFGVSLVALYTIKIARQGTIAWVKSVEKNIQEMDESLKTSFGFTPIEISNYLKEARKARKLVFKQ
ncbi:MAG: hypothetical protein HeimC3_12030 [Candidatus Heimdallarchaeota archaeon LC_3]|nr:MAG: hypothetical protein HeimC3_12030 [Candidatus Heimdallarchaeota archaeon LC_3]